MKANEVLRILRISKSTLTKYARAGRIKATRLPNGRYDYDEKSVYQFLNKDIERKTVVYARVSTSKQKKDLSNQIDLLKNYCFQNGWKLHQIYQDVASGISFDKRKEFFILLGSVDI